MDVLTFAYFSMEVGVQPEIPTYSGGLGIVAGDTIRAAADLGLGTCWIGAFNPDAARHFLGLPYDVEPLAFTPLGYPDDHPRYKNRKRISDLVRYEKW